VRPKDRARGALYGLAIGDALGMPTQMLSRRQIVARWGPLLTGFKAALDDHPIAAGMPAGAVTDDTEQAVLLGRLLVADHGRVDPGDLAAALLGWEREMAARGSLDLLGPSTKRALMAVQAGAPPTETGRYGDTNGAAMRITPVGIATAADRLDLVDRVQRASLVTHNTSVAVAAATAAAIAAARRGAQRGHWTAGADVAARIEWAANLVAGAPPLRAAEVIDTLVGTSLATQESVPAAFAVLSAVPADPWRACLLAASLGGDTDTIGARSAAPATAWPRSHRTRSRPWTETDSTSWHWLIRSSNCENHDHPERTLDSSPGGHDPRPAPAVQARLRGRGDRGRAHAGARTAPARR
jgi:ADP-ribosylglycohydrolase